MKKKGNGIRRIIGIVLFVIAGLLIVGSVTGYWVRSQTGTFALLNQMRGEAVLNTATQGLIDSIAADARLEKNKELRKDKNFRKMGTEQFQALCDEAEEAARREAETSYSDTSGVDMDALNAAIPLVEEKVLAYNNGVTAEKAEFASCYLALMEGIPNWTEFIQDKDEDAIWAAMVKISSGLENHADWKSSFLKLAAGQAEKEAQASYQESYNQVWSSISGTITDWSVYANAGDDELWAAMTEAAPALKDEATATLMKEDLLAAAKNAIAGNETATSSETEEETTDSIEVDYSYYAESKELQAMKAEVDEAYEAMLQVLAAGIPALGELAKKNAENVEESVLEVIAVSGGDFSQRYNTYTAANAKGASFEMFLASNAQNLLLLGIGVLLIALLVYFWTFATKKLGVSRAIITLFFFCLILAAQYYKINISLLMGNILERVSMYGVLVLAMLPGIQCGIGLNMGMTLGCVSGLFAIVTALNYNMTGGVALVFSIVLGILIAIPLGWAYSLLLNRMKGSEMTISTYVGFSFVSLMCMVWMAVPYKNPKIIWMLAGSGLRVTHSLLGVFAHLLDNLGSFTLFGITFPTGGLLFFLLCCLLMYIFSRSKLGIRMTAVGSNPRFAEASGITVDHMRTLGTVLSTVIAAVGIVVYSQAFGYAQLYNAPKQLGFIAASAILIGGASVRKAKVSHVIIGVILFEGVLSMGQQVANAAIAGGGLSEVMRIMISNGIIIYALTQSGGEQNG